MDSKKIDQNLQLAKNLSTGIWLANINRVKLTKIRGKFIHTMGYLVAESTESKQKSDYLYPEEALYLLENSNIQIYFESKEDQIPLSVEQCYELFFRNDEFSLNDYKMYKSLIRYGYILRRIESKPFIKSVDFKSNETSFGDEAIIAKSQHGKMNKTEILKKLDTIVGNISIEELRQKIQTKKNYQTKFRYLYDVFQPSKTFKKSKPNVKPTFKLVTRVNDQNGNFNELDIPNLNDFLQLNENVDENDVCKLFSFVNDSNSVMFYTFNFKIKLPFLG
ncbi:unnamed protein product [Brachionus calyciflorus]|uniref:tRNA-splicing endonuclease subunit Sen54 N-terminal domain-containing protein n=1 Tax=Brachionus calyciflorus TaxID=104777 RepID=A0A813N6L0_9BILA|nr:unnamed protein product [Brachionus calyciflorus]